MCEVSTTGGAFHGSSKTVHNDQSNDAFASVAIIILNWNGLDDTIACVRSLLQISDQRFQIILVDNDSTDGSSDELERLFPEIVLIRRRVNDGYAGGNNEGIRYALQHGAEYLLILNNDVVVEPNFLVPMIKVLNDRPEVGVVTCKAYFAGEKGKIYSTGGTLSTLRCTGISLPTTLADKEGEVSFISGCVLMVRKKVFETVGLFDEEFFMYFEDTEFSSRVGKSFKLFYTPAGVVYHKSGAGGHWTNYTEFYLYYNTRNRFLAFRSEHWFYQLYVIAFSLALALVKSILIFSYGLPRRRRDDSLKRIRAIWRGLKDGLAGVNGKALEL